MANTHATLNDLFVAVADAIRNKKNDNNLIVADSFPTEIANLKTGFDYCNNMTTSIADGQFKNCEDLKNVDCLNLENIGVSAFENCTNLKTVVLYDNIASIGENAFKGCSDDLTIRCHFGDIPETWNENWNPDDCEVVFIEIETWDISATSEDNVTAKLYNDVKNKGMYLLVISGNGNTKNYTVSPYAPWKSSYAANISSVIICNGVTSIGDRIFDYCRGLTSVNIPYGVTRIGKQAFCNCYDLTSITIPDSVTSIDWNAFYCCSSLTSITIPDGVTSISEGAFQYCEALTSITIPEGVTSIAKKTFQFCKGLTSITIPYGVTSIGEYACYNCTGLTSIVYTGTIAQWKEITFGAGWSISTGDYTIYCTDGTIANDGTITYDTTE